MTDGMSTLYQDLLSGSYDCVDRIVLNAYFRMGHNPAGFRLWWRQLTGSDETLENARLMRLAGRFSRRIHGYAKGHNIPVVNCSAGDRKHDIAEEHLAKTSVTHGLFLVLVGRAQPPVWDVSTNHHIEKKKPMPYVNHYSFHILDPDWGHVTIKISGHPPFPAQIILNGHEYVACQARKAGIVFTKHGNCFTHISDPAAMKAIKTILGYKRRPKYRSRKKRAPLWEVAVERPTYDLTIFKLHCRNLTLKIYTKGERVLRIEAIAHNTRDLDCGRSLEKFPEIVSRLKALLERFLDALSCVDQCFIADEMLENLPMPSQVGKITVGGIDLNKQRMRRVTEALIPLSASSHGFTASDLAAWVRALGNQSPAQYDPTRAAYDLKKLRGKQIVRRIAHTRRYETLPTGLRAIAALVVLRNKAIKPLLAAAQARKPSRGPQNPNPLDAHYEAIRVSMKGIFDELGLAA